MTPLFERLLIAALAWGALSFGAVYSWAYWPLAGVCALLGAYALVRVRAWQDARTRQLGLAFAAVALAISIQLISLPYALVARLSPAFDQYFREYSVAYHPASLHALSISPPATGVALALFVAFALLLLGLIAVLRHASLEWLLTQVMGLGLALAVVGVVQKALIDPDSPLVYGFWQPQQGGSPGLRASNPFGPFINRNHFAGWMVMALPLVAAYSYAVLSSTRRWRSARWSDRLRWLTSVEASRFLLISFSALLMGMALVLTGSRSGIASFVVAMTVLGYFVLRDTQGRRARLMVAGYLAVILAGAIVWAGASASVGRFLLARADAAGRVAAWQDAARIIDDFPLVGTGLGTFGQAMLVYQTAGRPVMYMQAHNDYLQLLAEGGILVAVPVIVAFTLVVSAIRRRFKAGGDDVLTYWTRVGAVAGLAGIAAQSAIEFSLQIPGNRVLFVLLLALAVHRGNTVPTSRPRSAVKSVQNAHRV